MEVIHKRMLPVVLGGGFWLLGNMVLAPMPAIGGGTEAQANPGCNYETEEFSGHQECGKPVNGKCQGNWVDGTYQISECNGANIDASEYCNPNDPGPQTVRMTITQGPCNFFQGFCVQGNTTSTTYGTMANQPECNNDLSQSVTP